MDAAYREALILVLFAADKIKQYNNYKWQKCVVGHSVTLH